MIPPCLNYSQLNFSQCGSNTYFHENHTIFYVERTKKCKIEIEIVNAAQLHLGELLLNEETDLWNYANNLTQEISSNIDLASERVRIINISYGLEMDVPQHQSNLVFLVDGNHNYLTGSIDTNEEGLELFMISSDIQEQIESGKIDSYAGSSIEDKSQKPTV